MPHSRRKAIEKLPLARIEALGEALLDFDSPDDLSRWLKKNAARPVIRKSVKAPKVTRKP